MKDISGSMEDDFVHPRQMAWVRIFVVRLYSAKQFTIARNYYFFRQYSKISVYCISRG